MVEADAKHLLGFEACMITPTRHVKGHVPGYTNKTSTLGVHEYQRHADEVDVSRRYEQFDKCAMLDIFVLFIIAC